MLLVLHSTKRAQMVSALKGVGRAIDKKYLQMKSPELHFQNENDFTEMVLMLPSTQIDQKVRLG